jgi:Mlc titration factor MtfA (ptsG expression regulator)
MINFIILLTITAAIVFFVFYSQNKKKTQAVEKPFPEEWSAFLLKNVTFYRAQSEENRKVFEYWIKLFLFEKKIIPVGIDISAEDKLLVASSAIIPVFSFPYYTYPNLDEVLIYPDTFDFEYNVAGPNRSILGMVGTGVMDGKMILSKTALEHGFWNDNDKRNVGIHEFIHLIDKQDGVIDGIPELLLDNKLSIPWVELVRKETEQIFKNRSDIDSYAGTNNAEFLAVIGEYFFESPEVLKKKHPELYEQLCRIFKQDPNLKKVKKGRKA